MSLEGFSFQDFSDGQAVHWNKTYELFERIEKNREIQEDIKKRFNKLNTYQTQRISAIPDGGKVGNDSGNKVSAQIAQIMADAHNQQKNWEILSNEFNCLLKGNSLAGNNSINHF